MATEGQQNRIPRAGTRACKGCLDALNSGFFSAYTERKEEARTTGWQTSGGEPVSRQSRRPLSDTTRAVAFSRPLAHEVSRHRPLSTFPAPERPETDPTTIPFGGFSNVGADRTKLPLFGSSQTRDRPIRSINRAPARDNEASRKLTSALPKKGDNPNGVYELPSAGGAREACRRQLTLTCGTVRDGYHCRKTSFRRVAAPRSGRPVSRFLPLRSHVGVFGRSLRRGCCGVTA